MQFQYVSLPRSGHHLVAELLRDYFVVEDYGYCEYYGCCQTRPCAHPDNQARTYQLQKSHDLALADPDREPQLVYGPDQRYIIQVRTPVTATVSDYHLWIREQRYTHNLLWWAYFVYYRQPYYKKFLHKWVLDIASGENVLWVHYDWFVTDPAGQLERIIRFITQDDSIDHMRVRRVIAVAAIQKRRNSEQFRYRWTLPVLEWGVGKIWDACMEKMTGSLSLTPLEMKIRR